MALCHFGFEILFPFNIIKCHISHIFPGYCHPLETLEMVPNKTLYNIDEKVHDIRCKDSLRYEGSSELICSADGKWIGNHKCSKRKNFLTKIQMWLTTKLQQSYAQFQVYLPVNI